MTCIIKWLFTNYSQCVYKYISENWSTWVVMVVGGRIEHFAMLVQSEHVAKLV